jgi:hypothetical protein
VDGRKVLGSGSALRSACHKYACEIRRLRSENEGLRHASAGRWNIEEDDETGVLLVCKNHHARSEGCRFEEYIPKPAERADVAAIGRTLSFFASAIKSGERWTDTCNAEQHNAMKSLAALRSELSRSRSEPELVVDLRGDLEQWVERRTGYLLGESALNDLDAVIDKFTRRGMREPAASVPNTGTALSEEPKAELPGTAHPLIEFAVSIPEGRADDCIVHLGDSCGKYLGYVTIGWLREHTDLSLYEQDLKS